MNQRLAQRRFLAIAVGHRLLAGAAERTDEFLDQLGAVRGAHAKRITCLIAQA